MNWIAELLPLCFIRWYAHLYVERRRYGDEIVMHVRPGVFIELRDSQCPLCKRRMDARVFDERSEAA